MSVTYAGHFSNTCTDGWRKKDIMGDSQRLHKIPWENHGQTIDKPWTNHGQTMDKPRTNH